MSREKKRVLELIWDACGTRWEAGPQMDAESADECVKDRNLERS